MKRLPPIALAIVSVLLSACSPKADPASPDAPPPSDFKRLDQTAAGTSFKQNVESHLDILQLSDKVSSAIVHKDGDIVYIFRGFGGEQMAAPTLTKLGNKWPASASQDCWIPWEDLTNPSDPQPGIYMGTFQADSFKLTAWIDRFATDLFICYTANDTNSEKK